MSNSIGGGGPSDSSLEARRKLIEEDRARELNRVESRAKEQIAKAQEARQKQIESIYEGQQNEIATKQQDADYRVERAKEAANSRIKEFEHDSERMTEEAKRQFQEKASLLQKNAQELEGQRKFMLKQHGDSMKKLSEDREDAYQKSQLKLQTEANKAYHDKQLRLGDIAAKGEIEINQLQTELRDRKDREKIDGARSIARLTEEREMNDASLQGQIEHRTRANQEQMQHLENNIKKNESDRRSEYENQLLELRREGRAALQHTHQQGHRKVQQVTDTYNQQLEDTRKHATKKTHDIEVQSALTMASLESEARTQEHVAREGFAAQKQVLSEEREKAVEAQHEQNDALRAKLTKDYREQATSIAKTNTQKLEGQREQTRAELAYQKEFGQKKLNDAMALNSKTMASQSTRAGDPFYTSRSLGPRTTHTETHVILEIDVPAHEQDKIRVTQQNDHLAISGTRRAESSFKTEEGRKVSTSSYQSYSELVPMPNKLDMRRLQRSYENGKLTFTIPKA